MIYLIDYENTANTLFEDIASLDSKDTLIIFYSQHAATMSITSHIALERKIIKKEYVNVKVGSKNALDFQLSTYLGALVANDHLIDNPNEYCIVSNDSGFDAVCNFWISRGVSISRINNFKSANVTKEQNDKKEQKPSNNKEFDKLISDSLINITTETPKVISILQNYSAKQAINSALSKEFGTQKAGEIYRAVKPYFPMNAIN